MPDAEDLARRIVRLIRSPTERDKQCKIGPSSLGNPCERCVGMEMANMLPDGPRENTDHFSLKAWTGTATHRYLEHLIGDEGWEGVQQEYTVTVGKIKKYGVIKGHTDLYSKRHRTVLDFKTGDVAKIRAMRAARKIPFKFEVQANCYGLGLENEGCKVKELCLFFIPRDSNSITEIWWWTGTYDRDVAIEALRRVENIWLTKVRKGLVETLKSDPDCFSCNSYRREVTFYN